MSKATPHHSRRQPLRHDLEAGQSGFHSQDGPRRSLAEEAFDQSLDDFENDPLVIPADDPDDTLDDEHEKEHTGEDDQIDDPVRIYLMQMGEIPMLSRQEETAVARRIDRSRRGFRHSMLPPTISSTRRSACWRASATTGCDWIARSRYR